jgi:hypothetical protein
MPRAHMARRAAAYLHRLKNERCPLPLPARARPAYLAAPRPVGGLLCPRLRLVDRLRAPLISHTAARTMAALFLPPLLHHPKTTREKGVGDHGEQHALHGAVLAHWRGCSSGFGRHRW